MEIFTEDLITVDSNLYYKLLNNFVLTVQSRNGEFIIFAAHDQRRKAWVAQLCLMDFATMLLI